MLLVGNRILGGGKDGRLYVLDTNGLAHVQSFQAFFNADTDEGTNTSYYRTYDYRTTWYAGPNIHGGPVAWDVSARVPSVPQTFIYAWAEKDTLKRFTFQRDRGAISGSEARDATAADPSPSPHGSIQSANRSMPGGMLSLSANGASNGIVWAVVEEPFAQSREHRPRCGPTANNSSECAGCVLSNGRFAEHCDATRGYVSGTPVTRSPQTTTAAPCFRSCGVTSVPASPNNLIPRYSKFTAPTVAHGKIVVATGNDEVRFYGLRNCTAYPSVRSPAPAPRRSRRSLERRRVSDVRDVRLDEHTVSRRTRSGTSVTAGGATTSAGSRATSTATAEPISRRSGTTADEIR